MKKVNSLILVAQSLGYRAYIIIIHLILLSICTFDIKFAIKGTLYINLVNLIAYYIYHYISAKKVSITVETKGFVLWFTGLPCSGKTTLADAVAVKLRKKGINVERLDGDIVRKDRLSDDLGFSKEDRDKNINRVTFVSKVLSRNNTAVLASFVSPYRDKRDEIRSSVSNFIEVYVNATSGTCVNRDCKGMWKKAIAGQIKGFTGYDAPYEKPFNPELNINTQWDTVEQCAETIINYLKEKKLI